MSSTAELVRDLSTLLRMGMPLPEALGFLARDGSPSVRKLAEALAARVSAGDSLGTAARGVLPESAARMLDLGEQTEALPQVMLELSEYFDAMRRVRARAREAMIYPAVVLVTCVITALVLQNSLHAFEPAEAAWNAHYGFRLGIWFLLGTAAAGLVLLAVQPTAIGEWMRWHLPYTRVIWRDASLVVTCRGLALALRAGCPLPRAIEMAAHNERDPRVREAIMALRTEVEKGLPLSAALRESGMFPASLADMAATGESAEDVAQAMADAAGLYERLVDFRTAAALAWLEPALVMGVGGVVAAVILTFWSIFYNWAGQLV